MVAAELSAESLMRLVNHGVVEKYRQRAVKLDFVSPVPLPQLEHLMRIRLTQEQLKRGESIEAFYKVLTELPPCDLCGSLTMTCREVPNAYRCSAITCPAHAKPIHKPHMMGVQEIKHHPKWHARYDESQWWDFVAPGGDISRVDRSQHILRTAKIPVLSACLVVLDRNYDAEVLAAVYRSCGAIGDMLQPGWKLAR